MRFMSRRKAKTDKFRDGKKDKSILAGEVTDEGGAFPGGSPGNPVIPGEKIFKKKRKPY